jgi:hypothetical protein
MSGNSAVMAADVVAVAERGAIADMRGSPLASLELWRLTACTVI